MKAYHSQSPHWASSTITQYSSATHIWALYKVMFRLTDVHICLDCIRVPPLLRSMWTVFTSTVQSAQMWPVRKQNRPRCSCSLPTQSVFIRIDLLIEMRQYLIAEKCVCGPHLRVLRKCSNNQLPVNRRRGYEWQDLSLAHAGTDSATLSFSCCSCHSFSSFSSGCFLLVRETTEQLELSRDVNRDVIFQGSQWAIPWKY